MKDLDLDACRKFVHTPKDGAQAPENESFYLQHYAQNKFIQSFMRNVDNQCKKWSNEQPAKIAHNFNSKFMKFMTDNSPIRNARKIYNE